MSSGITSRLIQPAFQIAAAGLGAAIAGPLGGALGGFLADALGKSAAALAGSYAEKFGEEAGKKLFDIGADSVAERLKNAEPDLAAAYRESLRRSLAQIQPDVDENFKSWFNHWNICLKANVPLYLDELHPAQLDSAKLDDTFRKTMERLDAQGLSIQEKSESILLKIRTAPDALLAELKRRLPERFKENFQKLIDSDRYQSAWREAKDVFEARLMSVVISIAGGVEENGHKIDLLLGMGVKIDQIFSLLAEEKYKQPAQLEIPHEIPSPVEDFTDRAAELQELQRAAGASRTLIIFGEPGLGKTELARRLASEIGLKYPHGHIYVDLKGTTASPLQPSELLSYLVKKFGPCPPGAVDVEELANRYRTVMYGKRVLLFLDNVADSEQVRHVGPPMQCLLVITSHRRLDLPGMSVTDLPPFCQTDSEKFLLAAVPRIGEHATAIATLCGGLPFALRKAAATLSARPDKEPAQYVRDLSTLKARNDLAESVIRMSYDSLSSTEVQQQWCSLSCFVDPFSREAMQAIWNLPQDAVEPIIDSLMKSSLLHYDQMRRCYYMHDLDRVFARVHLENAQPYLRRHAAYFFQKLLSQRHPLELLDVIANEVFSAYEFCEQEQQRGIGSTVAMVREILNVDQINAASTVYLIARLFKRRHRLAEAQALYDACNRIAGSVACPWLEGACLRSIGEIHWILGDQSRANEYCEKAFRKLSSRQDYESRKELIFTLHLNSERYLRDGLLSESEKAAQESLEIREQITLKEREPLAGLSNGAIKLIAFLLQRGDLNGAKKMVDLERSNLEGISLASTLGQLGCAMRDAGQYPEAEALFQDALRSYEGNDVGAGWIHRCMVELELRRGELTSAREHVQQALSICSVRTLQAYEAYQIALAFIAAIRFYCHANETEPIAGLSPRLTELYTQIGQSDPSSKRKVAFAIAGLEETLSSCGRVEEAGLARAQRARFEASIQKEEAPSSGVESLADRWGCDALSLAWPGQLLRLLSPHRLSNARANTTI
jgi:tetratricopeptide (TPR) repeat protein/DNA polymerase III delta prime subunit